MDPNNLMYRRWNENGLEELILGLFCSVIGISYLTHFFASMPWLPLMACAIGMAFARKKLSARLIFPRTGYVVFRPSETRMRVLWTFAAVTLVIGVALAFWARSLPDITLALGPVIALIFTAIFVWSAIEYKLMHYYLFAAIALAIGVFSYVASAGPMWVMVGIGVPMALSGAWHLRTFVKTHPLIVTNSMGEDHHA